MDDLPEIQGKKPDSELEVWVAEALYKFGEPFVFQYAIKGGATMRGGYIIDFLLTRFNIPLEVFGDYWHEDELSDEEVQRLVELEQMFGDMLKIWESEAQTREMTEAWVRRNVLV